MVYLKQFGFSRAEKVLVVPKGSKAMLKQCLELDGFGLKGQLQAVPAGESSWQNGQEHCILLCNYFNYIDRLRRDRVGMAMW